MNVKQDDGILAFNNCNCFSYSFCKWHLFLSIFRDKKMLRLAKTSTKGTVVGYSSFLGGNPPIVEYKVNGVTYKKAFRYFIIKTVSTPWGPKNAPNLSKYPEILLGGAGNTSLENESFNQRYRFDGTKDNYLHQSYSLKGQSFPRCFSTGIEDDGLV